MRPDEDTTPTVPASQLRRVEAQRDELQSAAERLQTELAQALDQVRDLELQRDCLMRALAGDPPAWFGTVADTALAYLALTPEERAEDAEEQSGAQAMRDETAFSRYGG